MYEIRVQISRGQASPAFHKLREQFQCMTQDKKGNGAQPTTRNESNLHESGSQKRERERVKHVLHTGK